MRFEFEVFCVACLQLPLKEQQTDFALVHPRDLALLCCVPGGSFSSGEPQRDAVHVVPDGVRAGVQKHEQVWGGPEEVPRDRKGEPSTSRILLSARPHLVCLHSVNDSHAKFLFRPLFD